MSDPPAVAADLFDSDPLDEETELCALTQALHLAEGFKLIFVRCNLQDHRRRLVAALREGLPELHIEEVQFRAPIAHLLDELRWHFDTPPTGAVFVSGLEYSLPKPDETQWTPLIANLNAARDSFPVYIPCPLVLWVPQYLLTAIFRGAPDFFSVRSGAYFFAETPESPAPRAEWLSAGKEWTTDNLPVGEKQERIAATEGLLADYQALPANQRDARAEIRLLTRLGVLRAGLENWGAAKWYCQQSLAICQKLGDRAGEGNALGNIGHILLLQGEWMEAAGYHQQSLAIYKEIGDRAGEGSALGNLGQVAWHGSSWKEAGRYCLEHLALRREIGDRVGEGRALCNVGAFYLEEGLMGEAEACCQQSLALARELSDRLVERGSLDNLGIIRQVQGQWSEAEAYHRQSLAICQELGDRVGEGATLNNLSAIYHAQGDDETALTYLKQSLALCQQIGSKAGLREIFFKMRHAHGQNNQDQVAFHVWAKVYVAAKQMNVSDVLKAMEIIAPELGISNGLEGLEALEKQYPDEAAGSERSSP